MRSLSGRRQAGAPRRRSRGWPAGARGALRPGRGRRGGPDRRPGSREAGERDGGGVPARRRPLRRGRRRDPPRVSRTTRGPRGRAARASPASPIATSARAGPARRCTQERGLGRLRRSGAQAPRPSTVARGRARRRRGQWGGALGGHGGGSERDRPGGAGLASDNRPTIAIPIVADDRPGEKDGSAIAGASGRPLSRGPSLRRQPSRSPPSPKRRRRPRAGATRRGRARDAGATWTRRLPPRDAGDAGGGRGPAGPTPTVTDISQSTSFLTVILFHNQPPF